MNTRTKAFFLQGTEINTGIARGAIALFVVGILLVGVGTMPNRSMDVISTANAATAGTDTTYGNGPSGYFPDMFINQATQVEPQPEAF